jgi:uracil-DNA glycosylase
MNAKVQGAEMTNSAKDLRGRAVRVVTQRMEDLQRAGVTHLAKPQAVIERPKVAAESLFKSDAADVETLVPPEKRPAALEIIRQEVAACTRCTELAETRTQTVFGVGSPTARICFFGEAPGADEDRQGEPFVGRAGQLLTKMIQACGLKREEVYILNVLKCRPPGNRNPLPDEVMNCRGYFERQLAIIHPEIICCLGAVAAKSLLCTEQSIGKLRGRFHDYQKIPVVCTYHPAYLLRNPAAKGDAWEDLKMMMRRLGVEL